MVYYDHRNQKYSHQGALFLHMNTHYRFFHIHHLHILFRGKREIFLGYDNHRRNGIYFKFINILDQILPKHPLTFTCSQLFIMVITLWTNPNTHIIII